MSQDVGKTRASDCTSSTVVTCEKEKEGNMFNIMTLLLLEDVGNMSLDWH
jgi:hypothetical protein